ncbi:type II toxin-antitoxin system mRNA interferase toxin, RelE/StbE family [Patescibacteria group bacterium]|nr:type II toxin-antitoxin system mRNA interferase toxin, RelE/StbE family [Patescibacteria group bacterium]
MKKKGIDFSRLFDKDLKKADIKIKKKFKERLKLFIVDEKDGLLKNHGLTGKWRGYRSINVTGDWRAIYVEERERIIFVALGTHSHLYG